jgi:hypothetical protein
MFPIRIAKTFRQYVHESLPGTNPVSAGAAAEGDEEGDDAPDELESAIRNHIPVN